MPYKYTDKHSMYRGRRIPCGTLIEAVDTNRLLGQFSLRELLGAGVAAEVSNREADDIRRDLKKLADDAEKARKAVASPTKEKAETKDTKDGDD